MTIAPPRWQQDGNIGRAQPFPAESLKVTNGDLNRIMRSQFIEDRTAMPSYRVRLSPRRHRVWVTVKELRNSRADYRARALGQLDGNSLIAAGLDRHYRAITHCELPDGIDRAARATTPRIFCSVLSSVSAVRWRIGSILDIEVPAVVCSF